MTTKTSCESGDDVRVRGCCQSEEAAHSVPYPHLKNGSADLIRLSPLLRVIRCR